MICGLARSMLCGSWAALIRIGQTSRGSPNVHHDLRHQELRHDEEGVRLARQARRRLRISRLQEGRDRQARSWSAGARRLGWETLLNRAGTTFRKLPDKDKEGLTAAKAMKLMLAQPSMIKRPVLDLGGGKLVVGFKPELYEDADAHTEIGWLSP